MKKIITLSIVFFTAVFLFNACKKKYDVPPVKQANDGARITIANLKAKYKANINYKFQNDSNLYCVVTADEVSGNLYKDIYVKDATGALHIALLASGGLFIGDSIRINLKGIRLNEYNKLIQLDSVNSETNIVKLASGLNPQAQVMTISQVTAVTTATNNVQSKLIRLDNVEFVPNSVNPTFADPIGKATINQTIRDCNGNILTVRTSGYANFAGTTLPSGGGSIVAIASQYGTTMQLLIRNFGEANLTGPTCNASNYITKDFNDNSITSGGWSTSIVTGTLNWYVSTFSNVPTPFAKVSGYSGGNQNTETWLISPPVNLATATNPNLYFKTAAATFAGNPLEVLVSTNYTSGTPSSATWTTLSAVISPTTSSYVWTPSGTVSLGAYKNTNTRIAFKYVSTTTGACTYEVDDILIKEN